MSRYTLLCFSDNERYNGSSLSKQRDYFLALPSWVNRRQDRRKRDFFLIIGSDTGDGAARGGGRGQSVGIITFLQLTLAFLGRCLSQEFANIHKNPHLPAAEEGIMKYTSLNEHTILTFYNRGHSARAIRPNKS